MFLLCVLSSGLAFAGEEKFTRLDPQKWEVMLTGPGSAVQIQGKDGKNKLTLINRPYVFSKEDYEEGTTIAFKLASPEAVKADDGHLYGDRFLVLLASSGKIRAERSYEPLDGIIVAIDMVNGRVEVQTSTGPGLDAKNFGVGTAKTIKPRTWCDVVVKDIDGVITVVIDGEKIVSATVPASVRAGKKWAVSNREAVGPGVRASTIANLSWGKFPQSAGQ